jgi:diguanylate cyclase (GGDEF)-like protein/PAS domain S-box-containing protein
MNTARTLRLLLIEDDEDDYLITQDLLRESGQLHYQLDWVSDYQEALATLEQRAHDLYLVDYRLGAENGLDLIAHAQRLGITAPLILLTGQGDNELDASAIDMGAADYLIKGEFNSQMLVRSIRYALGRVHAQDALASSEARYRLLFEANPEAVYVVHQQSLTFLAVNQAVVNTHGYSREDLLRMTVADILAPKERERLLESVTQVLHSDASSNQGIWSHRHKDGHDVTMEVLVHKFEYDGTPAFLVMARDVTETIRARREVELKNKAFLQVFTNSLDGQLLVNHDGDVLYANPAAAKLLGTPQTPLAEPYLARAYEPGRLYEWSLPLSDGSTLEAEVQCTQTKWDGEPVRLLSLRDIRERKTAEHKMRLLQRSLEASYNGVLICDALAEDLPIIYANTAFERITGYSAEEAIGRNCRFLQNDEREQAGIREVRQRLALQEDAHVVLRNFRKDGTPFWNDLYIAPVPNELGEITHFIGVQNDISEQKRYESELAYNVSHDVLTGLPNRSLLEDRLNQGCQISLRYKRSLAVMFIDLDGFKTINESLGHQVGDQLLIQVAQRIGQQVRPGDTAARLDSDRFVVLLPDLAREEDVLLVSERLIDNIARTYRIDDADLHLTASIGITLSDGNIEQPTQLIQQANMAMHKAKQQGHNNCQWYTADLEHKISERVNLRNEMQKAIEAEAFQLHYQPQVDGRSGKVVGVEALLRWTHAEYGFISPAQFIPVAEETGQIIPLSDWVLKTACRDARLLADKGWSDVVMAVNVSPVQFRRANFVESVRSVLEQAQLPARLLELEITETVLLDNTEKAVYTLHALKDLGVQLSIDDFGTGFSSLNYLKRLPVDKIKIDRSFVQEVISDRHDAAITRGIISMAHHLDLKVIAEGVETESQVAFLKKSRCDEFQGYYFAKPMPLAQLQSFLRNPHEQHRQQSPAQESSSPPQILLLLDDEANILRALTRVLRRDGYQIITATNAQDAFGLLAKHDVQVILSDQRMPEMSGTEFFSRVKKLYPETMRVILSGYTDLMSVTEAINQGAIYKFLTKPWDDEQLRDTVTQAFKQHSLNTLSEDDRAGDGRMDTVSDHVEPNHD